MGLPTKKRLSRAQFIFVGGIVVAGLLLNPRPVFPHPTSPLIKIKNAAVVDPINVQTLRGNLHEFSGTGGNTAVFNGTKGKLLVDSGIGVSRSKIVNALDDISNQPLKYPINSHRHFDRADGNECLHKAGAIIIADRQTRKNIAASIFVEDWAYTFLPTPAGALPSFLFDSEPKLAFNGTCIQMRTFDKVHTNCDISVYFPHAEVVHVPDTWWNANYTCIDHCTGGSLDGMIAVGDHIIYRTTDKIITIPGHWIIGNLSKLKHMLATIRHNVSKLKKEGRSLTDTISTKPISAFDDKFAKFVVYGDSFTKLVYADV